MKLNSYFSINLLLLCLVVFGCNKEQKEEKTKGPKLPVVTLSTKTTDLNKLFVGDLQAHLNVEIRARAQGYLEKIFVDEGKSVKKGQLLFQLSDKEFKAELSNAEANLKKAIAQALSAKLDLERQRTLVEKLVISETELQVAEADYQAIKAGIQKAQSEVENARTKLLYTTLRAPFDGITDINPLKAGSLINEGTLLTTVSDITYINAYFNVSERDYLDYIKSKNSSSGLEKSEVRLILANGTLYEFPGIIEKQDGTFDENTGTISFRAKFPNPNKIIKHGSTGTIQINNYVNNALLVPQKSSFEIQDKSYVFVIDTGNIVRMRSFVPQRRFADFYVVSSGLKAGDKVLFEGIQKVKDGMKIDPKLIEMEMPKTLSALNRHK